MASKSKKTLSYVDPKKIKSRAKALQGSDLELGDAFSLPSSTSPKKSAMKKQNREYFGGLLNDEGDSDVASEYPGMHVKRRSERFGSNSSAFERLLGNSGDAMRDHYKLTCMDRFLWRFFHPNIAFFHAAEGIKRYMTALDKEWSPILKLFEWPYLPGGQHKKARGYNYITHSLWVISYAAGTAFSTDNDKEEFYRDIFENLVLKAEALGGRLQDFVKPVNTLENMFEPFDEMARIMDVVVITPPYFGVDSAEIFGEAIIPDTKRYRIRDYLRLKIYTRDVHDMEWAQFRDLRFREQMTRVQNGMSDILSKMEVILRKLPSVLKLIKAASGKSYNGHPTLYPHIMEMKHNMKTLFRSERITSEEERMLRMVFEKAQENVQYVIEQAIFAIVNIWEVILMTRLSYKYVLSSPNACGTMKSMDAILKGLRPNAVLGANVQYEWKQFYEVNCASLLRKVPVFIQNTVEVAIHLDGFSNPEAQISAKRSVLPLNIHSKRSLYQNKSLESEALEGGVKSRKSEPNYIIRAKSKVKINDSN